MDFPEAPIPVAGFPTCASGDGREVEKQGDRCRLDGGKPASLEILRRSVHRQLRQILKDMALCEDCAEIPMDGLRCQRCSWSRGAAMGIVGIVEQLWGDEEFRPWMERISRYSPGWQENVERI